VDDAATALLAIALAPDCLDGLCVNVGRGAGHTLRDLADVLIGAVGRGSVQDLPAAGSAGASVVTDVTRLRHIMPTWAPMPMPAGLSATVRWYRGEDDAA
jgi:nucleoside-diphosphate-sugar epimerase